MLKTRAGNHGLMFGHITSVELQPTERIDRIEDRVVLEEQGEVILPQPTRIEVLTEEMAPMTGHSEGRARRKNES